MTLDQPLELITIVMINDDSLSFKSLIILYGLQVENYCNLHVCAAARGPEIKDECILVLTAKVTTIIPQLLS